MGYTRRILSKRDLSPIPTFYSGSARLDFAETYHFHLRNVRLEFTRDEFARLSKMFTLGFAEWLVLGRPTYVHPNNPVGLGGIDVNPVIGDGYAPARGTELSVELQQQTDYVHLQYRSLQLVFTRREFTEFAETVTEAADLLKNLDEFRAYPSRTGFHHIVQARNRVTNDPNPAGFWTGVRKVQRKDGVHDEWSMVFNEGTENWDRQYPDPGVPERLVVSKTGKIGMFLLRRVGIPLARTSWGLLTTLKRALKRASRMWTRA